MNAHFATRNLNPDGSWKDMTKMPVSSADASPTGSQMPRIAGLAQASKVYRNLDVLKPHMKGFSQNGNEVVFGTIGNASCAEGLFWETINAVGVLQVPLVMSIWDDDYGISVPNRYQITKSNISEVLKGFQRDEHNQGYEIFVVKAWDYPALLDTYARASHLARAEHVPCFIHVIEVTQPQGHSTSGSHERYKSAKRLEFEKDFDCISKMREWMIAEGMASEAELDGWEKEDRKLVRQVKNEAWEEFLSPIRKDIGELADLLEKAAVGTRQGEAVLALVHQTGKLTEPARKDIMEIAHKGLLLLWESQTPAVQALRDWKNKKDAEIEALYNSHLLSESVDSPLNVQEIKAIYTEDSPLMSGFEILNRCFESILERDPRVLAFGEDVGHLGDVNQGFAGLQEKFGEMRVTDTGIREATIAGQAIGLALRGLRPIAEIQYLDYFIYALQTLSDDLATLQYRTKGGQKAPAIIRTRGHRLEGIWHAGSPLGMIVNALRGMHVLVPRNMTQAAGFYNTLMQGDDPALIIEVLNGYRLKEKLPENLDTFTLPLGVPEILREGSDLTVVTYGACCRIVLEAAEQLESLGIDIEVIDVQCLLPFDLRHIILDSLKKTNRILFVDEDVPGGGTAYMMQQVIEKQGGYRYLDSEPATLTSRDHRTAFGTDGDYWSKPQVEHVFKAVYEMLNETDPKRFPSFL
jgi:pyruvate/2-oxoglutarate/acetoin dehydrogenase E1 component